MALLSSRAHARVPTALGSASLPARPLRLVLTRAEPPTGGARVTREYRDGDADVTVSPPAAKQTSEGLYVDADAPRAPRPKSNLSKEMKTKLRQEYMGLGGAENTAMNSNYFLWMCGIVAVLAVCSKLIGAI
ncbi:hypothetical protein TSOC_006451 [Tetrabaena socialis]|uniref:Uncharacterized protein n=1 Tax=Tetrabaena socialis TaxID=47790 RepID=A0A2J8A3N9_9CHLO|nr:hypothetical protein TSOC_006451 [Tetrabaena socialis]|eukprot:PNH07123.1 hypothetical protein TSOC_006451 [Tetrabaena socialis]